MRISWRAQGLATIVGTVVGTGGYWLNLGSHISPSHPGWALFIVTLVATVATMLLADEKNARGS